MANHPLFARQSAAIKAEVAATNKTNMGEKRCPVRPYANDRCVLAEGHDGYHEVSINGKRYVRGEKGLEPKFGR